MRNMNLSEERLDTLARPEKTVIQPSSACEYAEGMDRFSQKCGIHCIGDLLAEK